MDINSFLKTYKGSEWLNVANQFLIEGTNKQKSDYVRKLYNKIQSEKQGLHIVLGCMHVPHHNKKVTEGIIQLIKDHNIVGFHLIGDFLDLHSLSSHDKDKINKTTLKSEYIEGNKVLDLFDSVLPKDCQKTFIYGNHEARWNSFCSELKNQTIASAIPSPEEALNLKVRNYNVYGNWKEDFINIGPYQLFHGVYCSANPVKAHIDKVRSSCIFAHTHRSQVYFDSSLHGINTGHLADINSEVFSYVSRLEKLKWQSGFAIINQNNKDFHAELITINNNSFYFGGKKY